MKKKLITIILALVGATAIAQVADYDTNRGFIHPGGLHTQADFDRVRRQLAEGNEKVTAAMQAWYITNTNTRHGFIAMPDSLSLFINGKLGSNNMTIFYIEQAVGADRFVIRTGATDKTKKYWNAEADGSISTDNTTFPGYPFQLIPIEPALGLKEVAIDKGISASNGIYDLQGRPVDEAHVEHGIYIINGKKVIRQ